MRFKDNEATEEDHRKMQIPRQALHAVMLKLPYQSQEMRIEAPLPKDLSEWLKKEKRMEASEVLALIERKLDEVWG